MVAPVGGSGGTSKSHSRDSGSCSCSGSGSGGSAFAYASASTSAPGPGCPLECAMRARSALAAVDRLLRILFLLQVRRAAIVAALYSMFMSIAVAALSAWRLSVNAHSKAALQDVYLGVMIAYIAIFCSHICLAALSALLLYAIIRELVTLVVPWVVGSIAFMSLEAVATVYSNVLRDHVNRQFDGIFKAEAAFFIVRMFLTMAALFGVLRYYKKLRAGVTWKGPEMVEL